jgi:ribonuclease III
VNALTADLADLRRRIGYDFRDEALLVRALTHRSWCAEHPGDESNERLEFLGDAILGFVIADVAYHRHVDMAEGKLTDLRKAVVNATSLAAAAQKISLGSELFLGKGELCAGGREKTSILSDALEAVIGAMYVDGGMESARKFILFLLDDELKDSVLHLDELDQKTSLQELLARLGLPAPHYKITESGPDHQKAFFAEVIVHDEVVGKGEGRSKKLAEMAAAREAGLTLRQRHS